MTQQNCGVRFLLIAFSAILAAGCAAPASKVRVDTVEGQLPTCQTFSWNPAPTGDATSIADQRVRTAVMQTLKAKGYMEVPEKADCRIAYQLNTQQVAPAKPRVGVGMGGGSGGVGGGVGISLPIGKKKGERGTFTIDVIDSAKNAQVWSGAVDASFQATEISDEEAKAVAEEVLAKYPDRAPR
ncbi:MAG TPA: DUF4136 domain-containing protein [Povalibacter sp.]